MYACREIEKLLNAYTDGELDEPDRLRVKAHLQECASCSQLARRKEDEARLLHSGTLVPALSADFTRRVMSNLSRSNYRAREGFISLRKLLTRPWLAPALVGLLLLVTVSWAASGRLLPPGHGKVSLQAPVPSANNPALTLPMTGVSEPAAKFPGKKASGESARPWSNRNVAFSPVKNPNTVSEAVYKTVETQTTNPAAPQATSKEELERQGYTVFELGYLPAGYSLASCYLLPPGSGTGSGTISQEPSGSGTAPLPGWNSLLLTYRNTQTSAWLVLEIRPVNSPAPEPGGTKAGTTPPPGASPEATTKATTKAVAPSSAPPSSDVPDASHKVNSTSGTSDITAGNQSPEADRITWQAQKHGASFLLTVSGNLPEEELQKVAASVQ